MRTKGFPNVSNVKRYLEEAKTYACVRVGYYIESNKVSG